MAKDFDEIATELKGVSATMCILSGMVTDAEARFSDEIIGNSIYSLHLQLDRLSEEIENLAMKKPVNRLKELREAKGIDLNSLADLTGVPKADLWQIEEGKEVILNTQSVAKLSEILEVKPSEIFPE